MCMCKRIGSIFDTKVSKKSTSRENENVFTYRICTGYKSTEGSIAWNLVEYVVHIKYKF